MADGSPHVKGKASVALLIIDMITSMEFKDSDQLYDHALEAAENISGLKKQAKQFHIPVIYVNDNYGRWQSDFKDLVHRVNQEGVKGKPIAELLLPEEDDYFVLKPQFSAFFATPLELLLAHLEVKTLIITGMSGNMCVQFTANDAYMRYFQLFVPRDCTASLTKRENDQALEIMQQVLSANTELSTSYDMPSVIQKAQQYFSQQ